jgi:type IV pilus assembly protein PilW
MPRTYTAGRAGAARGLTLVELMVGIALGLIATLAVVQVLAVSEGQRRTTASGADAQVSGALGLFALERDLKSAGYGLSSTREALACAITARHNGAVVANMPTTLLPVSITAGAGAASDTVRILASNKAGFSVPIRVMPPRYQPNDQWFSVASTLGVAQNDLMLAFRATGEPCHLFRVTANPTGSVAQIPRADDAGWNGAGTPNVEIPEGSQLINLGTLLDHTYRVDADRAVLQRVSFDTTTRTQVVTDVQPGIVLMRAFYGLDRAATPAQLAAGTGQTRVDTYTLDAAKVPTTPADWQRLLSVRIAIVARSGHYEKDEVTTANPVWDVGTAAEVDGAVTCGSSKCVTLDVGADVAGSQARHYRYKVYDTVVPLVNLLWRS